MIKLVFKGIDSLDVAIMGAVPVDVLEEIKTLREAVENDANNKFGILTHFGDQNRPFAVKGHGGTGGYKYTLVDQYTGTIVSIKNDLKLDSWNIFVSCRAYSLLSRQYAGMKAEIEAIMVALGVAVKGVSVNRIDQAFDFLAPEFDLHMDNFVVPGHAKVSPYYNSGHHLNDQGDQNGEDGLPIGTVLSGSNACIPCGKRCRRCYQTRLRKSNHL